MSNTSAFTHIDFDNSYASLPEHFFANVQPVKVSQPEWIQLNVALVEELGLDPSQLHSSQGLDMLAGNTVATGSTPIAMAYAGHQFGGWVPQLGDGRAVLLGEIIDIHGQRQDVQLKGAGRTPFSRGGDGRNWLGPVLREYLVSEAMAALGVPTTRALAAIKTGDSVLREQGPLPGAILARVAHSHVRVGTFQYFAARQDNNAVDTLMNYVINRHYPELNECDNKALGFLQAVLDKQARLIAKWQSIGFIHGVMNTDNCSVIGQTIDYGPCAFLDTYICDKVFSSIDRGARYAYKNQPRIAQWNLANLAQCLLPQIAADQDHAVALAQQTINEFDAIFEAHYSAQMCLKIGIDEVQENDLDLVNDLLTIMQAQQYDFTQTFSELANADQSAIFKADAPLHEWSQQWLQRLEKSGITLTEAQRLMQLANPVVIPRNHLIEDLIDEAVQHNNFQPFEHMLTAVTTPFESNVICLAK